MKKFLLSILCLMLVAVMAMALVACGGEEAAPDASSKPVETSKVGKNDPKTDVSIYKAEGFEESTLKNQVSWEGINSIPIKTADKIGRAHV